MSSLALRDRGTSEVADHTAPACFYRRVCGEDPLANRSLEPKERKTEVILSLGVAKGSKPPVVSYSSARSSLSLCLFVANWLNLPTALGVGSFWVGMVGQLARHPSPISRMLDAGSRFRKVACSTEPTPC